MSAAEKVSIEPSDNTIKFTPAKDGKISVETGLTAFNDLFTIGAFSLTGHTKFTDGTAYKEYPTDIEGLKSLQLKSSEAISELTDVITSLGMFAAYVDRDNIGNKHLNNHAWLVAGLGELLSQLVRENQEFTHTLNALSKQA
ncbi:MAG: hypothetical protein ACXV8O_21305 [Methylobacter sp.]